MHPDMNLAVDIILFCVIVFMVVGLISHRRLERRWDVADWQQLMDWARGYRNRSRSALAERCLTHAIGRAALFDRNDPRRAESYAALGELYMADTDWERAGAVMAKAVVARRRAWGENHPLVARDLKLLADIHAYQGELEEAERHYHLAQSALERSGHSDKELSAQIDEALQGLREAGDTGTNH